MTDIERKIDKLCEDCWVAFRTQPKELHLTKAEMEELTGRRNVTLGRYVNKVTAELIPVVPVSSRSFLVEGDQPFTERVKTELAQARDGHANINSAHEGYAVIKEELDEFWEIVMLKRAERSPAAMAKELVQVAAMAQRTAEDLGL